MRVGDLVILLLLLLSLSGTAYAQPKTDVVTLANGDVISGEISKLSRGRLETRPTIWGDLHRMGQDRFACRQGTVRRDHHRRPALFGSLAAGNPRSLVVISLAGEVPLQMPDVTTITPIGSSFWGQLDGSVDVGFSYTRSSRIAQLNINTNTVFRRPAFEARLTASGTARRTATTARVMTGVLSRRRTSRFRSERMFVAAGASFESNESLGLLLRSQGAFTAGSRLVNSNRAQLAIGAGLAVNDERNIGADPTQNLEGVVTFRQSYLPVPSPENERRRCLPVLPEPQQLGPRAHPARRQRQARGLEGCLPVGECLRHVR